MNDNTLDSTMSDTALRERPSTVTAVVVLTWIAAVVDIVGGLVLVFFADNEVLLEASGASSGGVAASGWTTVAIGVVVAFIASRLGKGSPGARLLVTVVMVVRVALGAYVIISAGTHTATEAIVTTALSAGVIYLLWTGESRDWFAPST